MQEPVSPIQITLPVRQLVEFLRRVGSIDNRFTGFDRANEGARIHRKLPSAIRLASSVSSSEDNSGTRPISFR